AAIAFGKLGNYRDSRERSFALWDQFAPRETVVAALHHTVAVRTDGTVLATGENEFGECNVSGWTDIIAVSASSNHTVGLRSDGTVVAAGNNDSGQCDVSHWTDIVAIFANSSPVSTIDKDCLGFTVGIKSDGSVVTAGYNGHGQLNVSDWSDVVCVTTATIFINDGTVIVDSSHVLGLRADGTVVIAGENEKNWCDPVKEWTDIVSVYSSGMHIVGLKSDGTTVSVVSEAPALV
ncbi:MAG: hypothetical protein J6V25_00505, partial [Oscillospiraceae bacterium]|nr:hypothetical protein [Oscillospiraceae bacterium]